MKKLAFSTVGIAVLGLAIGCGAPSDTSSDTEAPATEAPATEAPADDEAAGGEEAAVETEETAE